MLQTLHAGRSFIQDIVSLTPPTTPNQIHPNETPSSPALTPTSALTETHNMCLSPTVLAARQMTAGDDAVLAAAIADVLLGIFDLPTAATAALPLTRRGIDTLCANG